MARAGMPVLGRPAGQGGSGTGMNFVPTAFYREAVLRTSATLLIAAGVSEAVRLSGWTAPLSLRAESGAPAEAIAALVREVEREPQLVPGVRRVIVLERSGGQPHGQNAPDGWVRYEVEGVACGLPWRVRFWTAWQGNQRFWWRAEGGTGRPEQYGALWLIPHG